MHNAVPDTRLRIGAVATAGRLPRVSIVIRNYNYAQFLAAAIDSALAQTYAATEVVVVDDGSTDASRAILTNYATRCRIVLQDNGGEGAAINAGFAAASGDIVIFLDSDDTLLPRAVATVVAAWRPDMTRMHYRMHVVDAAGAPAGVALPYHDIPDLDFEDYLARYGEVPCDGQSFNAYSAAALRKILPLDPSRWQRAPDCYLSALTTAQGRTHFIAEPLGCYRWHRINLGLRNSLFRDGAPNVVQKMPNLHAAMAAFIGAERWQRIGLALPSGHWLNRILSYRLNRAAHPYPQDRLVPLATAAWHAIRTRPQITTGRRALFCLGLIAAVGLPRVVLRAALPFLLRASRATGQPGWLKRMVFGPANAPREPRLSSRDDDLLVPQAGLEPARP